MFTEHSYCEEITLQKQGRAEAGVACWNSVHSCAGIQKLRLKGKEKMPGCQENLRWVKLNGDGLDKTLKLCPLSFLFQKERAFEVELPCEARPWKEKEFSIGNSPVSPHLSLRADPLVR